MFNWLTKAFGYELRSLELPTSSLSGGFFGSPVSSGVNVNADTAMTLTAVQCAVSCIASNVASLPFHVYKRLPNGGKTIDTNHLAYPLINSSPNGVMNSYRFMSSLMYHALIFGNAYAQIIRNGAGQPVELSLLNPKIMQVVWSDTGIVYRHNDQSIDPGDILHIAGLSFDGLTGENPIMQAREALGLTMASERFGASFFGNGASPGSYYKIPQTMSQQQQENLRESLNRIHQGPYNANKVAVLAGVDWVQTSVPPEQAQFLGTREFQILEVCRIFNVPPHKLMDFSRSTFSNIEETNKDFYTTTLRPWISSIASEYNIKLFSPVEQGQWFADVKMTDIMIGNMQARSAYYQSMLSAGVMCINEVRAEEGLNPIGPEGDKHLVQLNLTTLDLVGEQPEALPALDAPAIEPGDTGAPEAAPAEIQALALNGAQIVSFLQIISAVTGGTLPVASAKGVIAASFPAIPGSVVDGILSPLATFTPAPEPGKTGAPELPEVKGTPDPAVLGAVRGVLLDSVGRMIRREVLALRKVIKRDETPEAREGVWEAHRAILAESLAPGLIALNAITGKTLEPVNLARDLIAESRALTLGAEDLGNLLDTWDRDRAEAIVERIINE